jgi:hypothetical protein
MPPRRDAVAQRRAAQERFLDFYPEGFHDAEYVALERDYKWDAHRRWVRELPGPTFAEQLADGRHEELARTAIRIEATTNLLYSFEKIAVRDAVSSPSGAKTFACALFDWIHGRGPTRSRFERWRSSIAELPRHQTRVLTWPVVTSFGFVARPRRHIMLKPLVTRRAAEAYGYDLQYRSGPTWPTYERLLGFTRLLRADLASWEPRDLIDIQSFIWVLGSEEYD